MKKGAFVNGVNILDSNPKAYKQVKKKYKMQNKGGLIKKAEEGTKLNGWQKLGNFLNRNKTLLNGVINGISTIGNSIKTTNYSNEFDQATKAMQEQSYNEKYKEGLQLAPMILQSDGNVNYSNIDYQQFAKQYAEGNTDLSAITKFKMDRLNEKQKQINAIQGSGSNIENYIQQGLGMLGQYLGNKQSAPSVVTPIKDYAKDFKQKTNSSINDMILKLLWQ